MGSRLLHAPILYKVQRLHKGKRELAIYLYPLLRPCKPFELGQLAITLQIDKRTGEVSRHAVSNAVIRLTAEEYKSWRKGSGLFRMSSTKAFALLEGTTPAGGWSKSLRLCLWMATIPEPLDLIMLTVGLITQPRTVADQWLGCWHWVGTQATGIHRLGYVVARMLATLDLSGSTGLSSAVLKRAYHRFCEELDHGIKLSAQKGTDLDLHRLRSATLGYVTAEAFAALDRGIGQAGQAIENLGDQAVARYQLPD